MSRGISAVDIEDERVFSGQTDIPLPIFAYNKGYLQGKIDAMEEFTNELFANGVIGESAVRRIKEVMREVK